MTESDIVHQRTISSEKFFENVICKYTEYVYSIVWNRLYPIAKKEDVEEAVSDVFIKFYNSIDKYNPEISSLKTYLAILAKNTAISKYRSIIKSNNCLSLMDEDIPEFATPENDVEKEYVKKEDQEKIINAIFKLRQPNGTIVFRKYYLNETIDQIAARTGLSVNAVEKRLKRSLEKLKTQLEGDFYE